MTRKIKRTKDFEIALRIKQDDFICPPREAQRNWLLNRAIKELSDDLIFLNQQSKTMIQGQDQVGFDDRTQGELSDEQIMEDWQIPVMKAMAEAVTEGHGDILEVGFGRGVASDYLQEQGVKSHSIIECNDSVVERFHHWKAGYGDRDIKLFHGLWQEVTDQLGEYDGIFFHTYPLNSEEFLNYVIQSTTFAEHFFPIASAKLCPGGVFSYLSNETDSLSRAHQRLLFQHFSSFSLSLVEPLNVPEDSRDALWGDSMVIIKAIK